MSDDPNNLDASLELGLVNKTLLLGRHVLEGGGGVISRYSAEASAECYTIS